MPRPVLASVALAALVAAASWPLSAQSRATATNVPVIPHEAVPNFFKNPPGIYTGENMGIATNSKGHVFIYHRANETRLFEYSPLGAFIREIGRGNYGFAFAHSVRVDAQDNIWAVDEGTDTIVKFAPDGRVLMIVYGDPHKIEFFDFFVSAIQSVRPDFTGPPMDPPPLPFQLQDPQRLGYELAAVGLQNVEVETITETTEFQTGKDLWEWVIWSNPIAGAVLEALNLTDADRIIIQQTLERLVRQRAGGNGPALLSNPINIGIGIK